MPTAREDTTRLADLLRREHHVLADFLIALAAFDRGRRWVELGYDSLFAFLHRELGLSTGAAYYRKSAAELIQRFPEVVEPLRDGRLCFTSIVELSKNLTPENRDALLPRFFHVSKREAKAITAELQPVPDPPMRTVITAVPEPRRALVAPAPVAEAFHPDETRPLEIASPPAAPPRARAAVEPLTSDLRRMHLTVSRELLEALAVARDAVSHSHPGASDEVIIKLGLDLIIERHRKRRGIGCKPRRSAVAAEESAAHPPPPPRRKRARVPAAVWRGVGAGRRALRLAPRERRRLWLHLPGRARSREGPRPRRRHDRRRVPPPLPVPPGRLRAPALRRRPDGRVHAPEAPALLGAGRGQRSLRVPNRPRSDGSRPGRGAVTRSARPAPPG